MQASDRIGRRIRLQDLHILMTVVEAGSMGKAADRLHTSQPAVSNSIAKLEHALGVRLLDRTTRAVSLTDEGRRLYAEVAPLLTGIEDAVTLTSGTSVAVRGRLRVNVDAFFLYFFISSYIFSFSFTSLLCLSVLIFWALLSSS